MELRATVAPPFGALPFRTTNPDAVAPPMIEMGVTKSPPSSGDTVSAFCPTPEAVMRTAVSVVTEGVEAVVMEKVAVVDPAGTVTLGGTVAKEVMLLVRFTIVPPAGAGLASVTVPIGISPFKTYRAESASEYCGCGGLKGERPFGNGR